MDLSAFEALQLQGKSVCDVNMTAAGDSPGFIASPWGAHPAWFASMVKTKYNLTDNIDSPGTLFHDIGKNIAVALWLLQHCQRRARRPTASG
jgi:hypothetical protein